MHIEVVADAAWAPAVAERWIARLRADPELTMCLPTGETPQPVYSRMAQAVHDGGVSFNAATVFLLDEFGGLPPGDQGRCAEMIHRDLLDRVDLRADRLERLDPDVANVDAEVERYSRLVAKVGLGLTIVGLGMNGHVGLNEPGSTRASVTRRVPLQPSTQASLENYHAGAKSDWGLTLGISELLQSKEIWLLVTGHRKAGIVRRALTGPVTAACPASFLREHQNASAFVDRSAAARL